MAIVDENTVLGRGYRNVSRKVLLIAAEPREFRGILQLCGRSDRLGWPLGWARSCEWNGRRLFLVANGAGPCRAAAVLDAAMVAARPDAVASIGFCGALDPDLDIGDIVVARGIQAAERLWTARIPQSSRRFFSGVVATIDHVAGTVEEKRALFAAGASAVEMEAAGVAERATHYGLPLYCVRAVTDTAHESLAFDFNRVLRPDGHFDTIELIWAALGRPGVLFPELIRLRRRSRTAACALGEFIADCQF